jgi:hypothetical protein
MQVGYMLKNGNFKFSSGYPVQYDKGTLQDSWKRIGTNSLTICSAVMLVSQEGALMAHLNPDTCNLFLKPNKSKAEIDQDKKLPNYAVLEARYKTLKSDARKFFKEFKDRGSKKFLAAIIVGPNQNDPNYGRWMARELFGITDPEIVQVASGYNRSDLSHTWLTNGIDPTSKSETWRWVVADFRGRSVVVNVGGQVQNWQIP